MNPNPKAYKFLDKSRLERIIKAIDKGCTYTLACQSAGITYITLRDWMRQGEESVTAAAADDSKLNDYGRFYLDVREVEAIAAQRWLDKIEKSGESGQWQAMAWKLERRYRKDYGKETEEVDKRLEEQTAELKSLRETVSKCLVNK